jgi:hypothetical protein
MPDETKEEFAAWVISQLRGTLGTLYVRCGAESEALLAVNRVIERAAGIITCQEMQEGKAAVESLDLSAMPRPTFDEDAER